MNGYWMPVWERVLTMTLIAALFLLTNRIFGKKFSSGGRCIIGVILAVGFLIPFRIPILRIELSEPQMTEWEYFMEEIFYRETTTDFSVPLPDSEVIGQTNPVPTVQTEPHEISPIALLLALYLAGLMASLFCTLFRYGRSVKAIRRCGRAPSEKENRVFSALVQAYGISRPPLLLICDGLHSPFMFGIIRQTVVIPDHLPECSLALLLGHELMHCKRRDPLLKLFLELVNAIYWFHPLMFWFTRTLRDLCEQACDETLLADKEPDAKRQYSRLLVLSAVGSDAPNGFLFTAFKGGKQQMKKRISNILSDKKRKSCVIILALAVFVTVLSVSVYATIVPGIISGSEDTREAVIKEKIAERYEAKNGEKPTEQIVNSIYNLTPQATLQKSCKGILEGYTYESYFGDKRTCLAYNGQPIIHSEIWYHRVDENGNACMQLTSGFSNLDPALAENGIGLRLIAEEGAVPGSPSCNFAIEVIDIGELLDIEIRSQLKGTDMSNACLHDDGSIDYMQFIEDLTAYFSEVINDYPIVQFFSRFMERAGV